MTLRYFFALALSPFFFSLLSDKEASAQDRSSTLSPSKFTPNIRPELRIERRTSEIVIDGELNDAEWERVDKARNFTESNPIEGLKPLSETEAMLAFDDEYLYVAMIAYDDPTKVRARLTGRDNIFDDDMMGIIIDPFGDAVRAYEMYSNAYGIQADVLWTDNGDDVSYDILFESEGKLTATGWQIEMRIPFKSLRFPDQDIQKWRLTFWRNHPRETSHSYSWAAMNRNNPCTFCAFGSLIGLEGVKSGNQLEILPAFVTSQSTSREDAILNRPMDNGPIKGEIGLSARYALSQATSLEGTFNPDFSQIESDATQIDLNTTTALFYPERRPFFREGYDLFDTWIDAVYTRSVNDPVVALKTLTRSGSTNVGFLGSIDEHSPLLIPLEERTDYFEFERSYSGIIRGVHNFDGNNSLGAIGTVRSYDDKGWNMVTGLDSKVLLYESVEMEAQGLMSFTDGLENRGLYGDTPPRGSQSSHKPGYAGYLSFERFTNTLNTDIDLWVYSPEFRAANGFITRTNQQLVTTWSEYQFVFDSSDVFVRITTDVNFGKLWNFDGKPKDEWLVPGINFTLKGQSRLGGNYMWSRETFQEKYFPGIRRTQFWASTAPHESFLIGGFTSFGNIIARTIEVPELAKSLYLEFYGTFRPWDNVTISPSIISDRLDSQSGKNIYEITLVRGRITYQISREFSIRLVTEYNDYDHSLSIEPLVTYRINPFSVFYLGSSHGYESFGNQRLLDKVESQRQIFAKIQYLFQV